MSLDRVQVVTELLWPFRDGADAGRPYVHIKPGTRYGGQIGVDPFPAYSHDPEIVAATLERVSAAFPLPEPFAPLFYLLTHETLSRTNGQAAIEFDYDWSPPEDDPRDDGHQRPWRGYVVLSGKRIPPHPAVTRYLVAHEYGHIVEDWLIRGRREQAQSEHLLLEYMDRRGVGPSAFETHGRGGLWHRAAAEIFANDFRLIRTDVERRYWPHAGIDRPAAAIRKWWRRQS